MATWIRTHFDIPGESLVNLDHVMTIEPGYHNDRYAVVAFLSTGDRQTLTYFDGLEGKRPAARALLALWAEIQAGAQFIDMAAIGEAALEDDL